MKRRWDDYSPVHHVVTQPSSLRRIHSNPTRRHDASPTRRHGGSLTRGSRWISAFWISVRMPMRARLRPNRPIRAPPERTQGRDPLQPQAAPLLQE